MSRAERVWLIAIIVAAALLRLAVNDVSRFSPADEAIYTTLSQRLAEGGFVSAYPAIAREWAGDASWWRYPSPLRCGHLALTTLAVRLYGAADPRALAWLSTLAGIAVVPLLFVVARKVCDTRTALIAAAFAAVSPLELAMGRRALQDEVLSAAVLLALLAILANRTVPAILALAFALSVKETTILLFPALVVFSMMWATVWHRRPGGAAPPRSAAPHQAVPHPSGFNHLALFVAPPLLCWAAQSLLMRDVAMPFTIARRVFGAMSASYVVQYQAGPPHRILFDFFLLAPLVFVLACMSFASLRDPKVRAVAVFLVIAVAVFSLLPSKNLRFIVMLDPFVRLLAATVVARMQTSTIVAFAAANAAIELDLFRAVFIRGGVYDPVTHTLLASLGAVPRDAAVMPVPMLWPWICAAIAGALWFSRHAAQDAVRPRPAISSHPSAAR